ncbi:uncharacterized protein Dana_GF28089 [Drosophila ananassae]|uniref:Fibrinogen C-terminal domain-containing protein n=1 Tax=Drosophila ananassae TaxID=7217 RepID=A0A0N8NZN6_DROAN|nr:angiopoietin-related protein 4 [Drosophila ananassae]KPU74828.1 uncharacterized protein Dana_GF28089 [Drosophila ananassae]
MILRVILLIGSFLFSASLGWEASASNYLDLLKRHTDLQDRYLAFHESCSELQKKYLDLRGRDVDECAAKSELQKDYSDLQKNYTDLQEKDGEIYDQIGKLQKDYWDLQKRYAEVQNNNTEVLRQLNDVNVRFAKLQSQHLEVGHLNDLIDQKNREIKLLNDKISDLQANSDLAELTRKLSVEIDKVGEIVKSQPETRALPDHCPRNRNETHILQEIQIRGSDPFKVVCRSDDEMGSGWMNVYRKTFSSTSFNRTYDEYVTGFGNVGTEDEDEFFIGLQRLHLLTNGEPHEMMIYFSERFLRCGNFVIGHRSEGYVVKSTSKCPESIISFTQGTKFSTFDRDEDTRPDSNLASLFGFGWWFHTLYGFHFHRILRMFIRKI